jgi:hypothetical protein
MGPHGIGLLGQPLLQHSALRDFVVFVSVAAVPLVLAILLAAKPEESRETLRLSLLVAGSALIPIPLIDYAIRGPRAFAEARLSIEFLTDLLVGFGLLTATAFVTAVLSASSFVLLGGIRRRASNLRKTPGE